MLHPIDAININPTPIGTKNSFVQHFGASSQSGIDTVSFEGSFSNLNASISSLTEERMEKINQGCAPLTSNMGATTSTPTTSAVIDLMSEDPAVCHKTTDKDVAPAISAYQSGRWQQRFNELCEYRKLNGHCLVPSQWSENPQLSQWVKRQRYQYKLKREGQHSTMTDERIKILEDMGFVWDSHSAFWEERLNELIQFSMLHGHCNVPTKYPDNPELAVWAKCQRRHFKLFMTKGPKKSSMTMERISKLNKVGFVFDPREYKKRLAAAGVTMATSPISKAKKSMSSLAKTASKIQPLTAC